MVCCAALCIAVLYVCVCCRYGVFFGATLVWLLDTESRDLI